MTENNNNTLDVYNERIQRVETQIEIVTVRQGHMQSVQEKQTQLIEKIAASITASELATAAIRDRTDQHTKTIEHLQESESNISKILESMKTQLDVLKYVSGIVVTLLIAYIFSHFLK